MITDESKTEIINRFIKNVKNKLPTTDKKHCGSEGHWLEDMMEIKHNSKNAPDIFGYEMNKKSKKITFGDFSASEYIFSKKKTFIELTNGWNKNENNMSRTEFIKYFGNKNPKKHNRNSWSGKCVPKYGSYNTCGQKLIIDEDNNICIYYNKSEDTRDHDVTYEFLSKGDVLIVVWLREKMEEHINRKFGSKGFFICEKNDDGAYEKICFGKPFGFEIFIECVKCKKIFFDSGMYDGNNRNYSQFRSSFGGFWKDLISEEY